MLVGVDVERAWSWCCRRAAGWPRRGCRRCRPGTCIPSTDWRRDVAGRLAGVPLVDGGVEVHAGIGRGPGGVADLLPEVAGLQRLGDLLVGAADQVPVAIGLDGAEEIVLQRDRVVGVLAGDREVGLRIPVGVVDREIDLGVALPGELDDALDVVVRRPARGAPA